MSAGPTRVSQHATKSGRSACASRVPFYRILRETYSVQTHERLTRLRTALNHATARIFIRPLRISQPSCSEAPLPLTCHDPTWFEAWMPLIGVLWPSTSIFACSSIRKRIQRDRNPGYHGFNQSIASFASCDVRADSSPPASLVSR